KRTPFIADCVPTGMNTGVSMTDRRVRRTPARASPSVAKTCQSMGFISILLVHERPYIRCAGRGFGNDHAVLVDQNCRRRSEHTELYGRFVIFFQNYRGCDAEFAVIGLGAFGKYHELRVIRQTFAVVSDHRRNEFAAERTRRAPKYCERSFA